MPHLHRLHADDEGVHERAEQEQRRGRAADHGIPPREMNGVRDTRGRVQEQRERVQRDVGA